MTLIVTREPASLLRLAGFHGLVTMAEIRDRIGHAVDRAIRRWCAENGVERMGPNWDVFDHPREGQPIRTDVYYLVG